MATPIILVTGSVTGAGVAGQDKYVDPGEIVTLTDTEAANVGATYTWTVLADALGAGTSLTGAGTPAPTFPAPSALFPGTVTVKCVVDGIDEATTRVAVQTPVLGFRIPAYLERNEWDESGNSLGWHEAMTVGIRALDTGIGDLETGVSTNAADIATNTADIATNAANVSTNTADIATNTGDIATNTLAISGLDSRVTTNEADIATNAADIATNVINIDANATNIASNTASIAATQSLIGYELVETIVPGVATGSITFSGLNGNADGGYRLLIRWSMTTPASARLTIKPNGITASQASLWTVTGTVGSSTSNQALMIVAVCQTRDNQYYTVDVNAATSAIGRHASWSGGTTTGSSAVTMSHVRGHSVWNDTSTNITSLVVVCVDGAGATVADGITTDSSFTLYKASR